MGPAGRTRIREARAIIPYGLLDNAHRHSKKHARVLMLETWLIAVLSRFLMTGLNCCGAALVGSIRGASRFQRVLILALFGSFTGNV